MLQKILIGTRNSPLAIAQAEIVRQAILEKYDFEIHLVKFRTQGDKTQRAFNEFNGTKGLFTYELEKALLNHEIDIAVHSLKDMAVNQISGLQIKAYSKREDPRDSLIIKSSLTSLANEKIILGSSSLRRKLQLKKIFPNAEIQNIRGNINTRIQKLEDENFSGIVLASAGVKRLNLESRIFKYFSVDEIMPSPGQGILACQGRADENYFYLDAVNNKNSEICAIAERSFSECLGAGCNIPVGAYAFIEKEILTLKGLYIDEKSGKIIRERLSGNIHNAESIGKNLAEKVLRQCKI